MATTTNFGWETPDDTDLVKDGALAIRTLGSAIDTSMVDLKGGTTGQNLRKNSNTDMDFVWAGDTANTVIDAEGDLLVGDAADLVQRLAIGTTGQVLTVDTTVDGKIKWATPAGASSGPTFRAYKNADQTFNANTITKVQIDTESWDTDNCFDPTTNYRFTPNKSGYYQVNLALSINQNDTNKPAIAIIYKNGAQYININIAAPAQANTESLGAGGDVIYFNGTTDYIEAYAYSESGTARKVVGGSINNYFSAVWIRS